MRQSSRSEGHVSEDSRTTVAERIVAFLRETHPAKTAEHVAFEIGIGAPTVAKWLDRGSAPSGWAVFKLIRAYGPEFVCAVMPNPPAWVDAAKRAEEARRLRVQLRAIEARLARIET